MAPPASELKLAHVGEVRRVGEREFELDSRTRGGAVHHVDWSLDGSLSCRCEASAFRRECWALGRVRKVIESMTESMAERGVAVVPLQLQRPVALIPSDSELSRMDKVAQILLAGGVDMPKELDTPAKVMAVMLKGRALGLDPTIAIEHIHVIDGHAVPDAQIMAGILARDVPNSKLMLVEEEPEQSVTMRLILPTRGIDASYAVTMDDADVRMLVERDTPHQASTRDGRSYMTKPGGWLMYPRDRLRWHATKRLLKIYAPDVINGLASIGVGEYEERGEPEITVIGGAAVNRVTGEIQIAAAPPASDAERGVIRGIMARMRDKAPEALREAGPVIIAGYGYACDPNTGALTLARLKAEHFEAVIDILQGQCPHPPAAVQPLDSDDYKAWGQDIEDRFKCMVCSKLWVSHPHVEPEPDEPGSGLKGQRKAAPPAADAPSIADRLRRKWRELETVDADTMKGVINELVTRHAWALVNGRANLPVALASGLVRQEDQQSLLNYLMNLFPEPPEI